MDYDLHETEVRGWPLFDNGKPVMPGDAYICEVCGERHTVKNVSLFKDGLWYVCGDVPGHHVVRESDSDVPVRDTEVPREVLNHAREIDQLIKENCYDYDNCWNKEAARELAVEAFEAGRAFGKGAADGRQGERLL